jgi:hypothetical protein
MDLLTRALALAALAGCLGTTPEEAERQALPDDDDGDPEHRPGQPCLLCHDFAIAGTVYFRASDRVGIEGAEVDVTDDAGNRFVALTNRAGNFIVSVEGDGPEPRQRDRGQLEIPFEPVFPIEIAVRARGEEAIMESLAWREGSCAGCHRPDVAADSPGPVYVVEEAP